MVSSDIALFQRRCDPIGQNEIWGGPTYPTTLASSSCPLRSDRDIRLPTSQPHCFRDATYPNFFASFTRKFFWYRIVGILSIGSQPYRQVPVI